MTTTPPTADRAAIEAAITTELSREPEGDLTAWRSVARRLPGSGDDQLTALTRLWSQGRVEAVVIRGRTFVGRPDAFARAAFAASTEPRRLLVA